MDKTTGGRGASVAGTDPEKCPPPSALELKEIITVFSELDLRAERIFADRL